MILNNPINTPPDYYLSSFDNSREIGVDESLSQALTTVRARTMRIMGGILLETSVVLHP
jgi:hypothetical protein